MPRDEGKFTPGAGSMPVQCAQPYPKSRGEDTRGVSSRTTQGCLTCRIRKKKCPNTAGIGPCVACEGLQLECLGYGKRRPHWIKKHVREIREYLKIPRTLRGPDDVRALSKFKPPGWKPDYGYPTPASILEAVTPDKEIKPLTTTDYQGSTAAPYATPNKTNSHAPPPNFQHLPLTSSHHVTSMPHSDALKDIWLPNFLPSDCNFEWDSYATGNEAFLNGSG